MLGLEMGKPLSMDLRARAGGHDRLALLAGADALSDTVDEEVDDLVARDELSTY